MADNEFWKKVPGYEDYIIVSNRGNVYFIDKLVNNKWGTKTLMPGYTPKVRLNKDGYLSCSIKINGKSKTLLVHRLVAKAFIPNQDNLPCINHKDESKTNNFIWVNEDGSVDLEKSNLEWCDVSYNNSYGSRPERLSKSLKGRTFSKETRGKMSKAKKGIFPPGGTPFPKKPIVQYSLEGNIIDIYPSLVQASESTGINYASISKCCLGNQKKAGAFKWKYVKDIHPFILRLQKDVYFLSHLQH